MITMTLIFLIASISLAVHAVMGYARIKKERQNLESLFRW